jgi:hypothetical protein
LHLPRVDTQPVDIALATCEEQHHGLAGDDDHQKSDGAAVVGHREGLDAVRAELVVGDAAVLRRYCRRGLTAGMCGKT